ncbi:hypothetical protein EOM09_06280, partial [bacterium]|nr:hypothetical protein [bacterium]
MVLEKIEVKNFRNLENTIFTPGKNVNYIIGKNAQGKTNLIEAAFNFGLKSSMRQGNTFTFFGDTVNVSSSPIVVNNLDLNNYVMYRYYYYDSRFANNDELVTDVNNIYLNSLSEDKLWRVAFSHRVRDPSEGSMAGNFSWTEWKYLMDYIENNYGIYGNDTVWF